jgi:hypothetical protein
VSLSNLTVKATYQGDGSNDTFAIPFDPIIDDSAETFVYIRDEAVDPITETLVDEGALNEYTLTGAVLPTDFHTNVVFNAGSIPAATDKVIIIRSLPLTQTLNLTNTNFNANSVNKALDRIVAMVQQLDEKLQRAAIMRVSEQAAQITLPEPEASNILQWNSGGTDLENAPFTFTDITDAVTDAQTAQAAAEAAQAAAETAETAAELAETNAETAETNAELAEVNAETAQALAEAAQAAAEAAASSVGALFVEHAVTDGQAATALAAESWLAATYSSVMYTFEIIRGTTVIANGTLSCQDLAGTWRIVLGPYDGEAHGVTWSLTGTTTQQLNAALDVGAGNGTIKLSRRLIAA